MKKKAVKADLKSVVLEKEKDNKKNKINLLICIIYAIALLILCLFHEHWFDEAQSWFISKNLKFSILQTEGHPFLWYFIENIFIRIGLTYKLSWIIPFIFTLSGSILFIYKSKINTWFKILIIFNPAIVYYCGCFVRSYCLIYFLVVLLLLIYPNRRKYSILYGLLMLLLINSHVLICGLIGALLLIDLYDFIKTKDKNTRKNIIISTIISVVGIILLYLQLSKSLSLNKHLVSSPKINYFNSVISTILFISNSFSIYAFSIFLLIFFILLITLLIKKKEYKSSFILIFTILFQFIIYIKVYRFHTHFISIIFLGIVFALSEIKKIQDFNKIILIILLIPICNTIELSIFDIRYPYSDSLNAYNYISKNIEPNKTIYCLSYSSCTSIKAYDIDNKYKFIYYDSNEEIYYTPQNIKEFSNVERNNKINKLLKEEKNFILIDYYSPDDTAYNDNFNKLYATDVSQSGKYVIVELNKQ